MLVLYHLVLMSLVLGGDAGQWPLQCKPARSAVLVSEHCHHSTAIHVNAVTAASSFGSFELLAHYQRCHGHR